VRLSVTLSIWLSVPKRSLIYFKLQTIMPHYILELKGRENPEIVFLAATPL